MEYTSFFWPPEHDIFSTRNTGHYPCFIPDISIVFLGFLHGLSRMLPSNMFDGSKIGHLIGCPIVVAMHHGRLILGYYVMFYQYVNNRASITRAWYTYKPGNIKSHRCYCWRTLMVYILNCSFCIYNGHIHRKHQFSLLQKMKYHHYLPVTHTLEE